MDIETSGVIINEGIALYKIDKYQEAIELLNRALDIDPKNVTALNFKSFALNDFGKYQEAIDVCDEVLKIDPQNIIALASKEYALSGLGKHLDALNVCEKILEIDPKDTWALNNKSFALNKLGIQLVQGQEAFEVLDELIKTNPKNVNALNYKAVLLGELGKYQEAIELFDAILKIDQKNIAALSNKKIVELLAYAQLRKEIEGMPEYANWRNAVLERCGRRCVVCGSTKNLEVDHRYQSFYSIIKRHKITNKIQAYECSALWDVNNGAVLCKFHHNQTTSSRYRETKS